MSTFPPSGSGGIGRRIEEAMELIELELRHAIAYVNDAVVPQVRRESIAAMRKMAQTLDTLANRFDAYNRNTSQAAAPGTAQNPPHNPAADPMQNPRQDTRA